MRVAVLGASGGMGSFFVKYFKDRGAVVRGSDPSGTKGRPARRARAVVFRTNREAVEGCDLIILAVPMDRTIEVAKEVAGKLEQGSTLVEISSVKGDVLPALRRTVGGGVNILSIHPLFGPALETVAAMKIAVITARGAARVTAARRLFPEARIVPMTRAEHDRAMAVVLSLTHLMNMVYAGTVAEFLTPEQFARVSTPNSSMQLALAEAVLAQDARLSYAIQSANPYSRRVARAASRELKRVLKMIDSPGGADFDEHFRRLSKSYLNDERARAVVREIYSAAEKAI